MRLIRCLNISMHRVLRISSYCFRVLIYACLSFYFLPRFLGLRLACQGLALVLIESGTAEDSKPVSFACFGMLERWLLQRDSPVGPGPLVKSVWFRICTRQPGSEKAIYYILCFCGKTLIVFFMAPRTGGKPPKQYQEVGLKNPILIKHFLVIGQQWLPWTLQKSIMPERKIGSKEALGLCLFTTTYRQAIKH